VNALRFARAFVLVVASFVSVSTAAARPALADDRAAFSGSFSVELKTSAQRALPLFDPVGEAVWSPGWAPAFARESDRTVLPEGAVFTTRGHGDRPTTWVLQRYDRRAGEIAYTVFAPEEAVLAIHIGVREIAPGTSTALVRYDVVATSVAGDRFVQEFRSSFPHMQPHWQHALDAAIAHRP
jgi:hypothetical protein